MKTTLKNLITSLLFIQGLLFSQSVGEIKGVVIDKETGKTAIGANVSVRYAGNLIGEASDLNGKYTLKPLIPGTYTLTASFSGKGTQTFTNIQVNPNKITFMDTIFLQDSSIKTIAKVYLSNNLS